MHVGFLAVAIDSAQFNICVGYML